MNNGFREFSEEEKEIVKQLIQSKENDLSGLKTERILKKRLSFEGIHCNCEEGYVEIFKKEKANSSESYRLIFDICLFLEELETSGFIIVDTIIDKDDPDGNLINDDFWIYDHGKYTIEYGELMEKHGELMCTAMPDYEKEVFHSQKLSILIGKYVFKKVIIPRFPLIQLKKEKFLSREEKQLKNIRRTLLVTIIIAFLNAFSIIASIVMQIKCSTKIESADLRNIAESTGVISNNVTPFLEDSLSLILEGDTLNIKK